MKFLIGEKVNLAVPLPFLKTSETPTMLRPPDLISQDEIGEIVSTSENEMIEVRFRRGIFVIPTSHLKKISA